ncbi:MAG: hypothetical protein JWM68_4062 [Verrucomicrobiales bacterium]|nr:hypothetical protein [Verrucomicrobiales bacterium]
MPIRINLLAEAQASEEARRRDPVKRAIWVCSFLIVAALAWSGYLFLKLQSAQRETLAQESRWKQNEGEFKVITESQKQMIEAERKLTALLRFSTNRFLWAPVLNGLQQAVVPVSGEIQLDQIKAVQTYEQLAAVPASKDKKTPAKPAASVEKISLILKSRDYGNPTEANYNKFKTALNNQPYFKTLLQKNEGVRLASTLAGPTLDPFDPSRAYYQFSLECSFQEMKRDE